MKASSVVPRTAVPASSVMLLDVLREVEDLNIKLAGCLERGDTGQALLHHREIHRLVIEAAVLALRMPACPHGRPGEGSACPDGARALTSPGGRGR
jgi:hypothetical protein